MLSFFRPIVLVFVLSSCYPYPPLHLRFIVVEILLDIDLIPIFVAILACVRFSSSFLFTFLSLSHSMTLFPNTTLHIPISLSCQSLSQYPFPQRSYLILTPVAYMVLVLMKFSEIYPSSLSSLLFLSYSSCIFLRPSHTHTHHCLYPVLIFNCLCNFEFIYIAITVFFSIFCDA